MHSESISFESTDKLNLKQFSESLEQFITTEKQFVDGSLVVSLNAPFGFGKSTFLNMWRNNLATRHKQDSRIPMPIMLNAWEADYCGDPLVAIISAITKGIIPKDEKQKSAIDSLREAVKDVGWFGIGIANSIVASATGIDALEAGNYAEQKKSERSQSHRSLLDQYEARAVALQVLKLRLRNCFKQPETTALVFVDELDRCRPDYAVTYLETIKHVFDVPELTFVLAVDLAQLETSVQALYGNLNFNEYYRKFAHRNINMPHMDEARATALIEDYINRFLLGGEKKSRRPWVDSIESVKNELLTMRMALGLTPRQLNEVFRLVGHTLAAAPDKSGHLHFGFPILTILLASLAVVNPALYHALGTKRATFSQICDYMKSHIIDRQKLEWWIVLLTAAYAPKSFWDNPEEMLTEWRRLGIADKSSTADSVKNDARGFRSAWGHTTEPISRVYSLLEQVRSFS